MSAHSSRSRSRHPDPKTFDREKFRVGHILFELCDHPENGKTFALIAGEATEAKFMRPMFTGFVQRGMGTQLRRLAHRFDELEADLSTDGDDA
ncbi:hypothetical protein TM1040_1634 [Ruegeria sp. TM1040]|uniref:hypothetical protein n=1 Tax=Ruegeria sp. (strain TM1040) TaxID=292414 RepID=UPI0000462388|nr:hypothetical protein [Ruegeria sp. TM1040]ABF64367.1 hypothetical protein TM1040_1634 [Ruegeria sp. TM1040]